MAAIESQQLSCQRQAAASETVGEQPEMADAHEAFGQHVEEEAAQKLGGRQGHDALLAAVSIILIAEGNALPVEGQQAVIGNGDAMGVAAQIHFLCCNRSISPSNSCRSWKVAAGPRQSSNPLL